jgi:hypothetical protein
MKLNIHFCFVVNNNVNIHYILILNRNIYSVKYYDINIYLCLGCVFTSYFTF